MIQTQNELICFAKDDLTTLALEIWRLQNITETNDTDSVPMRYSVRKLKQLLESHGISYIDLTGQIYDAGMAVDILDSEGQEMEKCSEYVIKEMISPIILHNGILLSHGQVILENQSSCNTIQKGDK